VVSAWLLYRTYRRDQPPADIAGPPPHPDDYLPRGVDRAREGEPLPELPAELRGPGHEHRHGPSATTAAPGLAQCSCGEIGTYQYGRWRPATTWQLWRHRRALSWGP
jgi:hypothetical protein